MLYYEQDGREKARAEIARMYKVLGSIPGDVVSLQDVQTMTHLLRTMDAELVREINANKQDVNKAVSDAVNRAKIIVVYEGEVKVAFTNLKAKIKAILTVYGSGKCKVEMQDADPGSKNDLALLGVYRNRAGAMRAIGRYYGKGNYKFVRQYSTKGRQ